MWRVTRIRTSLLRLEESARVRSGHVTSSYGGIRDVAFPAPWQHPSAALIPHLSSDERYK